MYKVPPWLCILRVAWMGTISPFPTSVFLSAPVLFLLYHYFLCKRHVHDYLMKILLHVVSIATETKRTSIWKTLNILSYALILIIFWNDLYFSKFDFLLLFVLKVNLIFHDYFVWRLHLDSCIGILIFGNIRSFFRSICQGKNCVATFFGTFGWFKLVCFWCKHVPSAIFLVQNELKSSFVSWAV